MPKCSCDKCGNALEPNAVFCPHCGAAVFHGNTPPPSVPSDPPSLTPDPPEAPCEDIPKKSNRKALFPPILVALAVILALILSWDTLAGIFSPGDNPQLSTTPSTEQTIPSTSPPQPTGTTAPAPTETDPPETTEPVTQPTETNPPETDPLPTLPGEPLSQEQVEKYEKRISRGGNMFYHLATTTVFSHPREINLHQLFYNGISGDLNVLTDQEFAYFSAKMEYLEYIDVHVLSPDNMNRVLIGHFGITLEETDKRGLDKFQYWEETDCYYWFGTDANDGGDIRMLHGSTLSDGSIQLLYSAYGAYMDAGLPRSNNNLWIMTFTPEGTIFSNLPA